MKKDKVIGWFMLWGVILLFELIWLYVQATNGYNNELLIFIVTFIFVTVSLGVVGMNILLKLIIDTKGEER